MHKQKFAEHRRRRLARGAWICSQAQDFKVCGCCLSISLAQAPICPLCHSYRWLRSPDAVRVVARHAQTSALPFTAGVAPRLEGAATEERKPEPEASHDNN